MTNNEENIHLSVYHDRSELHKDGDVSVFFEGIQSKNAKARYKRIFNALKKGYLDNLYSNIFEVDYSELDDNSILLLQNLINGLTSEVGRGLVGLTFLQLTIKSLEPDQSIRLHKGSNSSKKFSWKEGISMRAIDKNYTNKFLRDNGLLNLNADGAMMTRTLAENYPYTQLYKAAIRGPFKEWMLIVDALESGAMNPYLALNYFLSLLKNRSEKFIQLTNDVNVALNNFKVISFDQVEEILMNFYENTRYSARAFEVVIHSFMQALQKIEDSDLELEPLTQMRSANKKHGNVGDIELKEGNVIIEAWDAKYGKPYLYDELSELREKIEKNPGVEIAGFIVDKDLKLKPEVKDRKEEYSTMLDVDIYLFNFTEWIDFKIEELDESEKVELANEWIKAVVETFSRKRIDIAPIDEPCDGWLEDLLGLLNNQ